MLLGPFGILGLMDKGLDNLCMCTHCLCIVHLHLLQDFLVLLGRGRVPQELGVNSLKRCVSLWLEFLGVISVPFVALVVCGVVLGCSYAFMITLSSHSGFYMLNRHLGELHGNNSIFSSHCDTSGKDSSGNHTHSQFLVTSHMCLSDLFFLYP